MPRQTKTRIIYEELYKLNRKRIKAAGTATTNAKQREYESLWRRSDEARRIYPEIYEQAYKSACNLHMLDLLTVPIKRRYRHDEQRT